jgi:hypothetical protein
MRRRRELIALLALAAVACSGDHFPSAPDGGVADAASDGAATDGAVATDAGADTAVAPRTPCGPSTCKLAETCCVYTNLSKAQYECHNACAQPQNGDQLSALKCSGTADCLSGQVCCIQQTGSQNVSACSATPCTGNQVQLCDPSAQDAGCLNATCSSNNINDWKLPGTFGTCGGVAVP